LKHGKAGFAAVCGDATPVLFIASQRDTTLIAGGGMRIDIVNGRLTL
jgi:hypothetical protein